MKISSNDLGLFILRLGVGLVMLYFGCQKALGLFGGPGINGTVAFMGKMGFPTVLIYLAIAAEFLGALGVLAGLFTRVAAFGIFCTMVVATYESSQGGHLGKVFSSDSGMSAPTLFFPVILAFAALSIVVLGPGMLSLDAKFLKGPHKKKG